MCADHGWGVGHLGACKVLSHSCSLWSPISPPLSGQGWGCYSHFTGEEARLRSKNFSHVGLNVLKVTGCLWLTENQTVSRSTSDSWGATPSMAVGISGFLPVHFLVLFLFIAHSAGEMFFGPCLLEFSIFSLFTPDPASLGLGFSWKGCLWEWAFVWISLSLGG